MFWRMVVWRKVSFSPFSGLMISFILGLRKLLLQERNLVLFFCFCLFVCFVLNSVVCSLVLTAFNQLFSPRNFQTVCRSINAVLHKGVRVFASLLSVSCFVFLCLLFFNPWKWRLVILNGGWSTFSKVCKPRMFSPLLCSGRLYQNTDCGCPWISLWNLTDVNKKYILGGHRILQCLLIIVQWIHSRHTLLGRIPWF